MEHTELINEELQMMSDEDVIKNYWAVHGCIMGNLLAMMSLILPTITDKAINKENMAENAETLSKMSEALKAEMQRRKMDSLNPKTDLVSGYIKNLKF